jgi:hypothetical protein
MPHHSHRCRGIVLVAGFVAGAALGAAPVHAQSIPIVVPPIGPITAGIPIGASPVVVGIPVLGGANSRGGVTWSESGRADVDVDIDRHHGRAAAR